MGNTGEDDPEDIDLADCATLLGQPRLLLWVRSKLGKFASPTGTRNGRPFWNDDEVYRWAAKTHPELIRRIPIRYWPDAERPAASGDRRQTVSQPSCPVLTPWADALVCLQADFGIAGPGLSTAQPGDLTDAGPRADRGLETCCTSRDLPDHP